MSERRFRRKVLDLLAPIGAIPVENAAHDGCPDVVTVVGWIELKIAERPNRQTSIVQIDLRNSQRLWLRKWRQHGGRAWVLTKLDETWLLHEGLWAAENLGHCAEGVLRDFAAGCWEKTPTFEQLAEALREIKTIN